MMFKSAQDGALNIVEPTVCWFGCGVHLRQLPLMYLIRRGQTGATHHTIYLWWRGCINAWPRTILASRSSLLLKVHCISLSRVSFASSRTVISTILAEISVQIEVTSSDFDKDTGGLEPWCPDDDYRWWYPDHWFGAKSVTLSETNIVLMAQRLMW